MNNMILDLSGLFLFVKSTDSDYISVHPIMVKLINYIFCQGSLEGINFQEDLVTNMTYEALHKGPFLY